jgi:HEAT repeat protein
MAVNVEFGDYLASITRHYDKWQTLYTLTDATGKEKLQQDLNRLSGDRTSSPWDSPFDFNLMVQTPSRKEQEPRESEEPEEGEEKVERFSVLEGIRKYAEEHVLLVGRPGSGKSTALAKLALEEARGRDRIPILVELRFWQGSIEGLVDNVLRRHGLQLTEQQLPLLWQSRLLLLMDGLNELPSDQARLQLITFRQIHPQIPMIFTTRDLSVGGDFGIVKKLEMQPLTEEQMRSFVQAYLPPSQAEKMLQQLKERLRELGKTPLLLWMLCDLFRKTKQIPENLGMVFRLFTQGYERNLKQDVPIESDREWWKTVLQQLAWTMMQSPDPGNLVEFRVTITWSEAVKAIAQYLEGKVPHAADFARKCLRDLQKCHLIQAGVSNEELEFRHQLLQEYYASEELLERLPEMSDRMLQQQYLNHLKWTEPASLMLALVGDEREALRVVRSGLEVDAFLGARLVGEAKPEYQKKAVDCLNQYICAASVNRRGAIELLKQTGSEYAVPHLLIALQDENFYVRWHTVEALEEIGSEQAIDNLLTALQDPYTSIRRSAADALGKIGNERAINGLLDALQDKGTDVCWSVTRALGNIDSERAIDGLLNVLQDKHSDVRRSAAEALGMIRSERAIDGLLNALQDKHFDVYRSAAEALGKIGNERAINGLLDALQNPYSDVRKRAVDALSKIGTERAIDILLNALQDSYSSIRRNVCAALGKIGSERAIDGLLSALQAQGDDVRRSAAEALGKIGSERAIDGLLDALQDDDELVRGRAAEALGNIRSERAVDGLIGALKDQDAFVRESAAHALGMISSKRVVDDLLNALHDKHFDGRQSVAEALGRIGGERAVDGLLNALQSEDAFVRGSAAHALGMIGSEQAIDGLLNALQDQDLDARGSVAHALGEIGDERAINGLLHVLQDHKSSVCRRVAEALGKIGSERAIDDLLKVVQDEDSDARESAAEALGKIGSERAIDDLLKVVQDEDSDARESAAEALGMIGSAKVLDQLWQLWLKISDKVLRKVILSIQDRCKYYNQELEEERQRLVQLNEKILLTSRTLLILAVSPPDQPRLRLDREVRDIDESLRRSKHCDCFHIQQKWAVRPDDLRRALLDYTPQILHFCGHGEGEPGIILENEAGKSQLVSTEAIADLFKLFADKGLECVVLNACYAEVQANAIVQHIPYVIGMSAAILDRTALKFSMGFYDALGAGWSYEEAFEMGKSAIATEGIPEAHLPVLKQQSSPPTG